MKIIDNFLDDDQFNSIKNLLLGNWFPWYRDTSIIYDENIHKNTIDIKNFSSSYITDEKYIYQFGHKFYDNYSITSDLFEILVPIINKLNPSAIVRAKANLNPITHEHMFYDLGHVDISKFSGKTAIYYVNTNNGFTLFENGDQVNSVENRILIFDSKLKHAGITCTDKKCKCVINLNYYEWDNEK